jgi:glycosyltransferase involved in cell wall biosynthesis
VGMEGVGQAAPEVPGAPVASILVATRNRAGALEQCLDSILADSSQSARELIVVDNGSTDETRAVVMAAAARAPWPVIYLFEPRPGRSGALNRAIPVARAAILVFTDDDVVVHDGWADALVKAFDDPAVGAAAGRILPRWPHPPPRWMNGTHARLLTLPDFGTEARPLQDDEMPVGANMALRRAMLNGSNSPFDPNLGDSGGVRIGFEEWFLIAQVRGHAVIAYRPEAVIDHCIDASRMTWEDMRRAHFQRGFGIQRRETLEGAGLPPLPQRINRVLRTWRVAVRERRRNAALADPGPDEAWREFRDYAWFGKHIEAAVGGWPWLANWIAAHAV